jgi:hypothetical protein
VKKGIMMRTSHLLIHLMHLQRNTYKDLSLELVPGNLTIRYFRFLELFLTYVRIFMLPKSDMFVTLRNDGPGMDERDKYWSMIVHGDGSKRLRIEEDATSGDFRTLKPP